MYFLLYPVKGEPHNCSKLDFKPWRPCLMNVYSIFMCVLEKGVQHQTPKIALVTDLPLH